MTEATSYSIMTRREMSAEHQAELLKASRSVLDQLGFPEDLEKDKDQTISAAKGILNMIGMADLIQWPENPTPDEMSSVSEQIMDILDPSAIAFIEEHNRIQDSSTYSEDRPYQHMMFFVQHQTEIDLLQVDRAQHSMINRSSPKHRLAELGLSRRCFCADSLIDTIAKVRQLRPQRLE
jgi:hypothetical protein